MRLPGPRRHKTPKKRGNWVVQAVANSSYRHPGIRHFRSGLYKAEAKRLAGKWKRKYKELEVYAVRWEDVP